MLHTIECQNIKNKSGTMFISQSNLINEKLKQLKQETSSQNYEDYEVTMSAKRPTSLIVQTRLSDILAKKSSSLCSSPTKLSRKTSSELRRLAKPRPMSTTIEFPLSKRILRQMSCGSCNSLKPMNFSYSSNSSMCSFKSSSELSTYLSNSNINEKLEALTPPRARIRQKRLQTISSGCTRRQSWNCNSTQSAAFSNNIKNLNNSSSTNHSPSIQQKPPRSNSTSSICCNCQKPSRSSNLKSNKSQLNMQYHSYLKSQHTSRQTTQYVHSDRLASNKKHHRSLSGTGEITGENVQVNSHKRHTSKSFPFNEEFKTQNKDSSNYQIVNMVKYDLNKLGSSMPNLYQTTVIKNNDRRQSMAPNFNKPNQYSQTASDSQNTDLPNFNSLHLSDSTSSFLNKTNSYSNFYCCCFLSEKYCQNLFPNNNNSPIAPSIPQLSSACLRGDLRPRNSSTSSFSGSPVPKIEEEIDPIEEFEFQINSKHSIVDSLKKGDMFSAITSHLSNESAYHSLSSSQSSSAIGRLIYSSSKQEPSKLSIETNDKKPKLKCCQNLNFFQNVDKVEAADKQQKQEIKPSSSTSFCINERESRSLNRSTDTSQMDSSYGSTHDGLTYSNYYPGDYPKKTRAKSLNNGSPRVYQECNIIQLQNERYKKMFPKACKKMRQDLEDFINSQVDPVENLQMGPVVRFIHNQIIEIAKHCLDKSEKSQLTCAYFDEITSSLEKLLVEARDKCVEAATSVQYLRKIVEKLLLIVVRTARLLECLEFDQHEFFCLLDAAEASTNKDSIQTSIPKYIVSKLGLDTVRFVEGMTDSIKDLPADGNQEIISNSILAKKDTPSENDFETIKLISNGAYGAVHLVRHKLGERYAMKKIKKSDLLLKNQLQQVFTERDIMIFTDNPFVVALICTFETKSSLCMVMEYVEGGDVATLIQNMGPLSIDIARSYFAEATLAVEYLHNYGIIHRDLKPDNFLVTSLGHIKLTDFGLSKVGLMNLTSNIYESYYNLQNSTKVFNDKQICGTPQYLSPEVILRQGYGKTVDWWSMGIILYEFLTSFTPFNGNTPEELFANVISGEILWPEEGDIIKINDDAKNLINSLLNHDPLERLGAGGASDIKNHEFFLNLHWNNLLFRKADFIPQLDGDDDTSYFDSRSDRYNHESIDEEKIKEQNTSFKDDGSQSELFASFSSYTSRFQESLDITSSHEASTDDCNLSSTSITNELAKNPDNKPVANDSATQTSNNKQTLPAKKLYQAPNHSENKSIKQTKSLSQPVENSKFLQTFISNFAEIKEFNIKKTNSNMPYGFTWLENKVYTNTDKHKQSPYTIQHIVDRVDNDGPAYSVGLRKNYLITHVNGQLVSGNTHSHLINLIFNDKNCVQLKLNAIDVTKTKIKIDDTQKYIGNFSSHRMSPQRNKMFHNNHYNYNNRYDKSKALNSNDNTPKTYHPRAQSHHNSPKSNSSDNKQSKHYHNHHQQQQHTHKNTKPNTHQSENAATTNKPEKSIDNNIKKKEVQNTKHKQTEVANLTESNSKPSVVDDGTQAYSERVRNLIPLSLKKLIKDYISVKGKNK